MKQKVFLDLNRQKCAPFATNSRLNLELRTRFSKAAKEDRGRPGCCPLFVENILQVKTKKRQSGLGCRFHEATSRILSAGSAAVSPGRRHLEI